MENKIKLLYLDDEPLNLMLFKTVFRLKYETITAESGEKGLEELARDPDIPVVITDMSMPGMSGLDFIIIAREKYPQVKYFLLTGYGITDEIKKAQDDGLIYGVFHKPFKMSEIEQEIDPLTQR
jgi:two-component system, response regulator, stage 0 sporulation protein F